MPLDGLRVIAFEARRANELAELIRRQGGIPFIAAALRETPIENNPEAFAFAERLFRREFDMIVFLTGVGTRALYKIIESRYPGRFPEALRNVTTVARGPKPAAALREMGIPPTVIAPEPNTWHEILAVTEDRPAKNIAVQEYGRTNTELLDALRARGGEVTAVRVYRYDLPEDTAPLREAARRIAEANADLVMFTTSVQIAHLLQIAAGEGIEDRVRAGLTGAVVASIGPTTTEALEEHGVEVDIVPEHPKMGFLVKAAADRASDVMRNKMRNKKG